MIFLETAGHLVEDTIRLSEISFHLGTRWREEIGIHERFSKPVPGGLCQWRDARLETGVLPQTNQCSRLPLRGNRVVK